VLAATTSLQAAAQADGLSVPLLLVAAGSLLLIFGMWWSYFKVSAAEGLRAAPSRVYWWGYGHFVVFASIAALGAGLQIAADAIQHTAHISDDVAAWSVAIPTALFLVTVGLLHGPLDHYYRVPLRVLVGGAVLLLLLPLTTSVIPLPVVILTMGLVVVVLVGATIYLAHRRTLAAPAPTPAAHGLA
jgi:low temperature requirement protein LtrA